MMRTGLLFCIFLLFIGSSQADDIKFDYKFDNHKVTAKSSFSQLELKGCMNLAQAGLPALPWHTVSLLLPPGHKVTAVNIERSNPITIQLDAPIFPAQFNQPLSIAPSGDFVMDQEAYAKNSSFPTQYDGNFTTQFLNGYGFCLSTFSPVEYNPSTETVTLYQTVSVVVETAVAENSNELLNRLSARTEVQERVAHLAQNSEAISNYSIPATKDEMYDILIVTSQQMESGVQSLADMYLRKGLSSNIATMNYIEENYDGRDDAEKLRNYIVEQYTDHDIQYVILGGDVQLVPYRGLYCSVQSSSLYEDNDIPADIYFSGMDGDWDENGNSIFGEYQPDISLEEADLLPELSVARMTFNNVTDFAKMMNKTEKYQFTPVIDELENILLAGEDMYDDPQSWGGDYMDLLVGFHDDNGYETTGFPTTFNFTEMYDRDMGYWGPSELKDQINTGSAVIHHAGHSNSDYVMRFSNSDITNSNFPELNGDVHNFLFAYSQGCIAGAFDENDCIAEKMVGIDNFAVAVAMNSRYGWFNEGQTEGPSQHIEREFVNALYALDETQVGTAHQLSKVATAPWVTAPDQWEDGALRWCMYDCNILGDPVLSLWSYIPQLFDSVTVAFSEGQFSTSFEVTSELTSYEGSTVVLLSNYDDGALQILATAVSGADGMVELSIDEASFPNAFDNTLSIWITDKHMLPREVGVTILSAVSEIETDRFEVYPNPASDQLNISFETAFSGLATLYSTSGMQIKQIECKNHKSVQFSVSELSNGVYFLQCDSQTKKIVISK